MKRRGQKKARGSGQGGAARYARERISRIGVSARGVAGREKSENLHVKVPLTLATADRRWLRFARLDRGRLTATAPRRRRGTGQSMNAQHGIARIAVIDNDSGFLRVLTRRFDAAGWEYRVHSSSVPAEELVAMKLNALVVDPVLLGPLGWDFIERVCGMLPDIGVIVCTQGATVAQRVRGLRLGADDWVAKPCHPDEVMARIEAVVRRHRRGRTREDTGPLVAGELEVRPDRYQAYVGGESLELTRREFELAPSSRRPRGQGAGARRDLPARLGLRDDPRRSLRGRLRAQAALQAPEALAGVGVHPHPLRDRLPVRPEAARARGWSRRRSPRGRCASPADQPSEASERDAARSAGR